MTRRPDEPARTATAADGQPLVAEFQRPVDHAALGRRPKRIEVAATPEERAAIARYLGLIALDRLDAGVEVRPWRNGVALAGRLQARVTQACVVTLDPVTADIAQDFDRYYLPADTLAREQGPPSLEVEVDAAEGELPEALPERAIPLGDVLVEELSLALDPFPRVAGAHLPPDSAGSDASDHPFAALASLRRRD